LDSGDTERKAEKQEVEGEEDEEEGRSLHKKLNPII